MAVAARAKPCAAFSCAGRRQQSPPCTALPKSRRVQAGYNGQQEQAPEQKIKKKYGSLPGMGIVAPPLFL
jgi:hypothetical protein